MLNLNELTLGQIKELKNIISSPENNAPSNKKEHRMIGAYVIIRTDRAGVWCGILEEKDGKEVILTQARRMWLWWAKESISLSGVALYGAHELKSKIVAPVESVWLEAIEIIPCTLVAAKSLMEAPNVKAQ